MRSTAVTISLMTMGLVVACTSFRKPPKGSYFNEELPGLTPRLFANGFLTTEEYEHGSPEFSPTYDEVYWGVRVDHQPGMEIIKFMKRGEAGWSEATTASFSKMGHGDLYPTFSHDGERIYFSSGRPDPSHPGMDTRRVWRVKREGEGWSEPAAVGFDSLDVYGLSISSRGTLYFMAQALRDRGTMLYDIYCSELKNGRYQPPERLAYPISTQFFEDGPFISADEEFLLFESARPGGHGGNDIYLSTRSKEGAWSEPRNLGGQVNSASSERFPYLSPDGEYLIFGSDRDGDFDIYWIRASVVRDMIGS